MTTGIVVGATGGIGAACARRLASSCDVLVLAGRRREALEELASRIGPHAVAVAGDLTQPQARAAIVGAAREPVRWLVIGHGIPLRRPLAELDEQEITAAYETNLVAPALLLRGLLDLRWTEPASIVVIGSISASRSLPKRAVYGSTKAGLEHLARSLAVELGPRGIRVNVVAPGVVDTPFLGDASAALDRWVRERVPLARMGDPDEVAEVVEYVVAGMPSFLTGARIAVDGGAEAVG
jgi:NAD(P)-dependent dehydrogenase (short-subunit alcohol dehydrogenase family)